MTDSELGAWLTLVHAPGIGPRTVLRLLEKFASPHDIVTASSMTLEGVGLKPAAIAALHDPDPHLLESVQSWLQFPHTHVLTLSDPRYPRLLREIADPPPVLYVRGDPALLDEPQIAIVGSRNPSPTGLEVTRGFARQLAGYGLIVTSGMAAGVDGAAHEAALEQGSSIAVLGTGPDRVYPAVHRDLAHRIAASGVLVTEFPPGQGPLAGNFPRRNRIISGLAWGVLVTEAALKSGSLITARLALEQGREVFAVPGSVHNPMARGCHALIRDGARLVEEPAEILAELAPQVQSVLSAARSSEAPVSQANPSGPVLPEGEPGQLLQAMGFDPVTPDELCARTGFPAPAVSSMLLVLELEGHVSSSPGGRYCRLCRE